MYMIPHEMEYKITGLIDMNGNKKALIWAELQLLSLKYGLVVEVTKDEAASVDNGEVVTYD